MVKDAEAHADEDKEKRAKIEARNRAEALVHDTEKNLAEHGDKIGADDKAAVEADVQKLKDALEGDDKGNIEAATQALVQSAQKIGEAIYKASQEAAAAEGSGDTSAEAKPAGDGKDDDKVVDADFEEVDDDKKKSA